MNFYFQPISDIYLIYLLNVRPWEGENPIRTTFCHKAKGMIAGGLVSYVDKTRWGLAVRWSHPPGCQWASWVLPTIQWRCGSSPETSSISFGLESKSLILSCLQLDFNPQPQECQSSGPTTSGMPVLTRLGDVMLKASASSLGGRWLKPRPSHTNDFKKSTCCFFAWRSAFKTMEHGQSP